MAAGLFEEQWALDKLLLEYRNGQRTHDNLRVTLASLLADIALVEGVFQPSS